MESAAEPQSERIVEKRPPVDDGDVLREGSPSKRIKGGTGSERGRGRGRGSAADVKKVAEMVLVLAAMGKMRGGKGPTDVEKELMAEARNRLAKVCEGFAPKDVFPGDAFGGVIEDLGLNKLKEQRLGFRPPKMSIAEKLLVSKRKMEEAESFSLPSTPHSARLQGNSATAVDNRGGSQPVRMPQVDKSGRMSITAGSFQSSSSLAQSTSATYQMPTSEIRPIVSSALPSSNLTPTTLPRVDRHHPRPDGRPNGSTQSSQIPATYSASSTGRTPTWSVRHQGLSSKSGLDNKVQANMSLKVEGASGVRSGIASQTTSRTISQTKGGPPSQGTNSIQPPPLANTHAEIGKIVQKLLQPKVLERPTWNPPSMDYMNKALTCQICMSTVTEIDTILICDACEKGYHLKCLQSTTLKGVPRGEWHCGKCLSSSNGKPLPPKYGRVMRNVNTQKVSSTPAVVSSTSAIVSSTSNKSVGASDEKNGQLKPAVNGNTTMEKGPGVVAKNGGHQTSGSEVREITGAQENYNIVSMPKMDMDNKVSIGSCPNSLTESCNSVAVASANTLVGKESVEKVTDLKPNSSTEQLKVPTSPDKSQVCGEAVKASPLKQSSENDLFSSDSKEPHGDDNTNNTNQLKEQALAPNDPTSIAASNGDVNPGRPSADELHAVNWVGDPIHFMNDEISYASCSINGHVYKSLDHVLIRSENGKLIPSYIQALWEDKNSAKWMKVNQYYFPSDLPESVGRPCGLESSEVYESTRGKTLGLVAGLIEGHCKVLPPRRFAEESDRRAHMGKQPNDHLPPLYLCKWIYDEVKGLFRDISC